MKILLQKAMEVEELRKHSRHNPSRLAVKQLRTLVAVSQNPTFSEAALSLGLTHAAVSQQMRALEADLDVALFDRTTRTPTLTPTGRALVDKAEALLYQFDDLVPSVLTEGRLSGEFRLGAVPTTMTGLTPKAIAALQSTWPDLRFRIRPGLTRPLITALERHDLDAALLTKPVPLPDSLVFEEIAVEPLMLITGPDIRETNPHALLWSHPFIRFNLEAVVGTMIETWLQARGVRVQEAMELDSLDAITSMVHANLGVSIVPRSAVAPFAPLPLNWVPLGGDMPPRRLGVAYRRDTVKQGTTDAVVGALRQAVAGAGRPT